MDVSSSYDLTGKTALVTGASRGIGHAIALGYAQAGADVAVLARSEDPLQRLAGEVRALGRKCQVLVGDVSDREFAGQAVESVIKESGQLDILVNNAGAVNAFGSFLDLGPEDWEAVLTTNLMANVGFTYAAGRHMVSRGTGSVVNVASVAGVTGLPSLSHYALTKAAVISLTRSLGAEWAASGVRVNALAPGWIDTKMTETVVSDPQVSEGLLHAVPARRWGDTDDVVGPAIFLASDAAKFVTGATLVTDGGLSCYGGGPMLLDLVAAGRVPA